jgi:hypothetical protein
MREAFFWKAAQATFESLSPEDQATVTYLVLLLERDPEVDGVLKRTVMRPPIVLRVLHHLGWEISYYVPDESAVVIRSITRA